MTTRSAETPPGPDQMPVEERERIRRNLTVAQWAAVVGGTLGALADLATHEPEKAFVLLVGIGVTAIRWSRKRSCIRCRWAGIRG